MHTPKISVIIPVYNVSKYLCECIDSVIRQSYQNLEIILIDDGSTDDSGRICDEYKLTDARIVAVHQQNMGLAEARNRGLAIATGEYVMFVDSDDWVDNTICEELMDALSKYKVQASMCSYVREYPGYSLPKVFVSSNMLMRGKDLQRRLCGPIGEELRYPENLESFNTMWGKLYPSNVLQGQLVVDLKEIGSSEDLLFNLSVFGHIENAIYINRPLYHYRKGETHSISTSYKPDLNAQWNTLYVKMTEIIQEHRLDKNCYQGLNNRIALNILGICLNCVQDHVSWYVKYKRIRTALSNPIRRTALKELPLEHMPLHWKIYFFSAKHNLTFILCMLTIIITELKGKV